MAKPAQSLSRLPELAGWLTFGEAAQRMGITVERVRQLASEPNRRLKTAHRIGLRPLGIVREAEVEEWIRDKQTSRAAAEERARESEDRQPEQ
jgi:hypothetical protein